MSNNHNSPSTSPEGEYRLKLNNWLQSRGWRDQLTWDEPVKNGPDHQPIWSAICKFNGSVYGTGEGKKLGDAEEKAARMAYRYLHWKEVEPLIKRRLNELAL